MTSTNSDFEVLRSDELFLEAAVASDERSLWRRLARAESVRQVAARLGSDPARIAALCQFGESILAQPHDLTRRHPDDIAACAVLVLVEQSPLPHARRLIGRASRDLRPSLAWAQRMARYCAERFADVVQVGWSYPGASGALSVSESPNSGLRVNMEHEHGTAVCFVQ